MAFLSMTWASARSALTPASPSTSAFSASLSSTPSPSTNRPIGSRPRAAAPAAVVSRFSNSSGAALPSLTAWPRGSMTSWSRRAAAAARRGAIRSTDSDSSSGARVSVKVVARIVIDRRRHLEQAFLRQLEEEKRRAEMAVSCPVNCVRDVRTLDELESELADAQHHNELVVVDFYNNACGMCKWMLPQMVALCKKGCLGECEVDYHEHSSALPVRFLRHNIRDDYDDLTDIAQLYRIKGVPVFAFFVDGSRVAQLSTRNPKRVATTLAELLLKQEEKQQ